MDGHLFDLTAKAGRIVLVGRKGGGMSNPL